MLKDGHLNHKSTRDALQALSKFSTGQRRLGDENDSSHVHGSAVFDTHVRSHNRSTNSAGCARFTGTITAIRCPADPTVASFYRLKKRQRCCDANESQAQCIRKSLKRQRLVHEASEDDWHIIIDTRKFKNCPFSKLSKLYQFSTELSSGKRSLRCKASEASDVAAWILWHQMPISAVDVFAIDTFLAPYAAVEIRETMYSECRSDFLRFLNTCAHEDIPTLLAAFYSVANAKRLLSPAELIQVIQAILRQRYYKDVQDSTLEKYVSHLCRAQMLQNTEDGLNFSNPAMSKFWQTVRLPEIIDGHAVFTRICFEQLRQFGPRTILRPWFNFHHYSDTHEDCSLAAYARQFWDSHYRESEAEETGIELAHELAQMMCEALVGCPVADVTILVKKQVLDASHGICDIYDFPVLSSILKNMGADTTYGKEHYLQSLATEEWSRLEADFRLRMSGTIDRDVSESDTILEPRYLNSILNELSTLDLTTRVRNETREFNKQRNSWSCNAPVTNDFAHSLKTQVNCLDAAFLEQHCKHTQLAEMSNSGVWEHVTPSSPSDDEDWEHIDDDALSVLG